MKHIIFFLVTILCCVSTTNAQQAARIKRIKDGDTFADEWNHRTYTCRLLNVDAPELSQAYEYKSYQGLSDLFSGKRIIISPYKKDLYGRTLVGVHIDGKRLDSLLIRKGYAWHYSSYSHESLLKQCMQDAILDKEFTLKQRESKKISFHYESFF